MTMTKEQAKFIQIVIDSYPVLDYMYIAKSFYKKYGLTDYCKGPVKIKDPKTNKIEEVYSAVEGESLYRKAFQVINNES
jgi:hypothetical protein